MRWRVGELVWYELPNGREIAGVVVARGDVRVGVAYFSGGRRVHRLVAAARLRLRPWEQAA